MTYEFIRRLACAARRFGALASLFCVSATVANAHDESRPLRVYGNTTTIELAPVLLAVDRHYKGPITVSNGGVPNLFRAGEADVATNADTQALRVSVDNPSLRIIFTVSEGFYRVIGRRSAGIAKLADLRGKKIATVPRTSSAFYLHKMLATVGLTEADVTIVPMVPLQQIPGALKRGEIDAVTVWEPEIQLAAEQLGADAIEFQDRSVYRELFNLNTTAENLANPEMRRQIVAFVRSLIKASSAVRRDPEEVWPLVAKSGGYDVGPISRSWHHHGYAGGMVSDLLDVLEEEEVWVAKERNRTPRTRAQLASLVDDSVLKEALEQERAETRAASVSDRLDRLARRVDGEEAIRAVKRLQHAYSHYLEAGRWDDAAGLFLPDAVSTGQPIVRTGRAEIRKGLAGDWGGGAPGLREGELNTVLFLSPVVTLNPDGRTAKGRWHAVFMRGKYGSSATWAGGIYENEYARENGVWKIAKERYFPQYAGPYETGWRNVVSASGAQPALVPYHYTPERVGTPVPERAHWQAPAVESVAQQAAKLASLQRRARELNDTSSVLNVQNAWGFYVDRKMWDDAAELFTAKGTLELEQQGVYAGSKSIRRALNQFGPQGLREGELNDRLQLVPVVTVAADGRTAKARGTQLSMTGKNGVGGQWGTSIYENTYVKEGTTWKIESMHVYPRMKADYAKGWAKDAQPADGPNRKIPADRPPTQVFGAYPAFFVPEMHFSHPAAETAASAVAASAASMAAVPRAAEPANSPAPSQGEIEAKLAEIERMVAVAEAFDGAENVSNAYGYYIDEFVWHDTSDLFAVNGQKELSYIGNYIGRERIRKSMITRYGNGGRRGVFMAIHQKTQPYVSVSADGQSARIRSRLFQINSQAEGDGSYIAGIYENAVIREDGVWKIAVMDLDYVWTTGYKAGWAGVKAGDARAFAPATAFPYPPDGPLRGVAYAPFPKIDTMAFHFRNPVSGRAPPVLLPDKFSK
jgi:ABC-type nitrate/sulfonate/bicarbonate transport system substrate-binding protein